jgi:hypothetical protein
MLVAVFALSAVAAASASAALPEFVVFGLPGIHATGTETKLETKAGLMLTCKGSSFGAEYYNNVKLDHVVLRYTGCKVALRELPGSSFACKSSGAKAEEIVLKTLTITPVYTNKAGKEAGLLFKPEATGPIAEAECAGLEKLKLKGSVVGNVTPVNKETETFTITYAQEKGVQKPTEYEQEGKKFTGFLEMEGTGLENFAYEQTGEQATETMTMDVRSEIKA